jgi:MerR family transcriptional regulator/heat shock protein HspR
MQYQEGLYIISVAARLLDMHQQTLRKYERAGFVAPQRTAGRLRLYSIEDVERLRQVKFLVDELGLNLVAVKQMLALTDRLARLYARLEAEALTAEGVMLQRDLAAALAMLGANAEHEASRLVATSGDGQ